MAVHYRRLALDSLAALIPTPIVLNVARRQLISFVYHVVSEEELPHVTNLYNYSTPELFERDLDFMQSHFTMVSYRDIKDGVHHRKSLPENPAFISFDDGMRECLEVAAPMLRERNIPCLFFMTKDFIDNRIMFHGHVMSLCISELAKLEINKDDTSSVYDKATSLAGKSIESRSTFETWIRSLGYGDRSLLDQIADILGVDIRQYLEEKKPYLSSEEVVALADNGFEIGAHSVTHRDLGKLDRAEKIEEIVASCHWIRELLDHPTVPFAFPYGGEEIGPDFMKQLKDEHDSIDLFFLGLEVLKGKEAFAIGRIWGESPLGSKRGPLSRVLKKKLLRDWLKRGLKSF